MIEAAHEYNPDFAIYVEDCENARYEDLMKCIVNTGLEKDANLDIDYNKITCDIQEVELED